MESTEFKFKQWTVYPAFARYSNDRKCLVLRDVETNKMICKASINVPDCHLADSEIIIKNYAENEGVLEALVNARLISPTKRMVQTGFQFAHIVDLLP